MLWWILPTVVLAGLPLLWILVSWIISRCGRSKFAQGRECPTAPEDGITVNVLNLVFGGWTSHNNATVATFTPEGVHLRTRRMSKLFHPPFFIPWETVVSCRKRIFFRLILPEFKVMNGNRVLLEKKRTDLLTRLGTEMRKQSLPAAALHRSLPLCPLTPSLAASVPPRISRRC